MDVMKPVLWEKGLSGGNSNFLQNLADGEAVGKTIDSFSGIVDICGMGNDITGKQNVRVSGAERKLLAVDNHGTVSGGTAFKYINIPDDRTVADSGF
jgi:hypothetical protein